MDTRIRQVMDFFERIRVPVKIERGDRVFPVSDHSSDVIRGLEREMDRLGVDASATADCKKVIANENGHFDKVMKADGTRSSGQMPVSWQPVDCLISQPDPPEMDIDLQKAGS